MISPATETNVFTNTEQRLLVLFYSGGIAETVDTLRQAVSDITDPDERIATVGLISKLNGMDETVLADFILESEGVTYAG